MMEGCYPLEMSLKGDYQWMESKVFVHFYRVGSHIMCSLSFLHFPVFILVVEDGTFLVSHFTFYSLGLVVTVYQPSCIDEVWAVDVSQSTDTCPKPVYHTDVSKKKVSCRVYIRCL